MDGVARFPAKERSEIFMETAILKGTTPAVVEKDFWVTWVLNRLFGEPELRQLLMFKGGTSLSKVYNLIERFSEDIDLVLDWSILIEEDPLSKRSKSKQTKLNKAINDEAIKYIGGKLLRLVEAALDDVCNCSVNFSDPFVIEVGYPAAFSDNYLRSEVRLEIGPLASLLPSENRSISCYAAETLPSVFKKRECTVKVIKAERTFWEKATILHQEAYRPEGNVQPYRYSRHYYDLAKMAQSPVKAHALADLDLLNSVVAFKQRFYPRGWARYDLAKPGTLALMPENHILSALRSDYSLMKNMIFGRAPEFDEILSVLQALQDQINR